MHPAHAVDQAFTSRPEDIRSLLRALPAHHFHPIRDDEASQGQPALKRALAGYNRRPHGSARPLSDSPGGLHVHEEWEFWVLTGVLHPADGVADPSSPVVLFNRSPQAEVGYLLLYGPSVLELAVRVLGYGLAWWALRGTPPKPTTYPQAFDFGSWN
jgi:hypothetical protein